MRLKDNLLDNDFLYSLLIGILVMLAVYIVFTWDTNINKRPLAIFSAALGLLTTLYLQENSKMLGDYSEKIVLAGLGVLLAIFAYLRRKLK